MPELKLQQSRLDGRYDIIECPGRGSYAEIYVAHDNAAPEGAPETVVIKALNLDLQETPDAELERTLVANFQNEAVALDRVRHPHIISRLGHGTAIDLAGTTFHYLVLEYLPGGDMAALSKNHPLSIEKTLYYLEQVCSGLAHAHRCGVIHRDIKPQNLLLTANRKTVKIADFGVARFEATEGAITRVGTNIYAAPEHNPLVQTGQLDPGVLSSSARLLTPAADVYSLAKTTYSLLAGEAPRRFAQHPITDLPVHLQPECWSRSVLQVLQKATQTRSEDRQQSVEEFWDDLSNAALRPTEPLNTPQPRARRRPSEELRLEESRFPRVPPRAQFIEIGTRSGPALPDAVDRRPRIVVPVAARREAENPPGKANVESGVAPKHDGRQHWERAAVQPPAAGRTRKLIVAVGLVLAFSGMLLATHRYVTNRWNPLGQGTSVSEMFIVGREGLTTTDVRLRPDAGTTNPPIGLAENGSRVKILNISNNWYEVQVVQHGRPKTDPYSSDRGWINRRFVRFD